MQRASPEYQRRKVETERRKKELQSPEMRETTQRLFAAETRRGFVGIGPVDEVDGWPDGSVARKEQPQRLGFFFRDLVNEMSDGREFKKKGPASCNLSRINPAALQLSFLWQKDPLTLKLTHNTHLTAI